jgi:transcriptional regulator with XRE-family HTH domain
MPPTRFDEARDYAFADQALALRERARLTQRELAALLGVSERAIGAWEAGLSYPSAARLRELIALYGLQSACGGIFSVARSADGQVLATGGAEGTITLWAA